MEITLSACGLYACAECEYLGPKRCGGCREGNAALLEAKRTACGVYACVTSRELGSCEECREPACALKRSVESMCPLRSRFENKRWWAGRMSRAFESRKGHGCGPAVEQECMSERVINRLRWYLTALDSFADDGYESISSWQLAERVGVSAALIRKDLSRFGEFGTPSYGYRMDFLRERIRGILRLDRDHGIIWVGACALRHQTAIRERLIANNCRIVAVFDVDEREIGGAVGDLTVHSAQSMREALGGADVSAAVIAVPGPEARAAASAAVDLGVKAVLNLSGELLVLPDHVRLCSLDLAGELVELCYYCG